MMNKSRYISFAKCLLSILILSIFLHCNILKKTSDLSWDRGEGCLFRVRVILFLFMLMLVIVWATVHVYYYSLHPMSFPGKPPNTTIRFFLQLLAIAMELRPDNR